MAMTRMSFTHSVVRIAAVLTGNLHGFFTAATGIFTAPSRRLTWGSRSAGNQTEPGGRRRWHDHVDAPSNRGVHRACSSSPPACSPVRTRRAPAAAARRRSRRRAMAGSRSTAMAPGALVLRVGLVGSYWQSDSPANVSVYADGRVVVSDPDATLGYSTFVLTADELAELLVARRRGDAVRRGRLRRGDDHRRRVDPRRGARRPGRCRRDRLGARTSSTA